MLRVNEQELHSYTRRIIVYSSVHPADEQTTANPHDPWPTTYDLDQCSTYWKVVAIKPRCFFQTSSLQLLLPSCRKLEFRLSALMDSDLAWVNGKSGRQSWRYADAQCSIISEAIYYLFYLPLFTRNVTAWVKNAYKQTNMPHPY